jgi:uncharacterized protein
MILHVSVIPNAKHEKREQQTDLLGNTVYKVRLTVPPIDGKANDALIKFLSKQFDLPKSDFKIVRGKTSRQKVVEVRKD